MTPTIPAEKFTQFDYLLNAMTEAGRRAKPAEHGYGDKRKALYAYVRELESRPAAQPAGEAPPGYVLAPTEPTKAILRPFYNCPPDELELAWQAALLIARKAAPVAAPPAVPQVEEEQQSDDAHNASLHREAFAWATRLGYAHVMAALADLADRLQCAAGQDEAIEVLRKERQAVVDLLDEYIPENGVAWDAVNEIRKTMKDRLDDIKS